MDMQNSLKRFKEKLIDYLLEIHWMQWSALGVTAHIPPVKYWIMDTEALIISTISIGLDDKRLLSACTEWLIKNSELINFARLKRVRKGFLKPLDGSEITLLDNGVLKLMFDTVKRYRHITAKFPYWKETERKLSQEYKRFFDGFQIRGVVKPLEILQSRSLLQLQLRGYFGVDAKTEVFIYLMVNDSGNSNSIARNIFGNQRNIYTILERWRKVGVVKKIRKNYSLCKKKEWFRILGLNENAGYLDWVRCFRFLDKILKVFSIPKWSGDEYSISSKFRDFYKDISPIGHSLNIRIPEPAAYKGAQYFESFTSAVIEILESLRRNK
jgi:hypothetical protein